MFYVIRMLCAHLQAYYDNTRNMDIPARKRQSSWKDQTTFFTKLYADIVHIFNTSVSHMLKGLFTAYDM